MRSSASPALVASVVLLASCSGVIGDAASSAPGSSGTPAGVTCTGVCVGASRMARITRPEYVATLRAAFGDATADAVRPEFLPPDDAAGPFTSNAFLPIDRDGVAAYGAVADDVAASVRARATELLACDAGDAEESCVEAWLRRITPILVRRPIGDDDIAPYRRIFDDARTDGTFDEAIELVASALVQSPFFLYRVEIGVPTDTPDVSRLTGSEIAARLSLYLWKSGPDQALLAAASEGTLDTAEGVMTEARRMLDDPRADASLELFVAEWLGIANVAAHEVDADAFPEFSDYAPFMEAETTEFGLRVLRSDAPTLRSLLTADWTVAAPELAPLYGSSRPDASGVLSLDATRRGVLTQASFLTAHSHDPSTAAVHRGKAIRERLLCQSLPPPPPVDTIIDPDPTLSTRQRLEQKTSPAACASCHSLMNPLGFAFGHFDSMGAFQEMDDVHEIDATGWIAESDVGEPFDGAVELSSLLADSDQVRRCMSRQMMRYALARYDEDQDEPSIADAYDAYEEAGYDLRELIVAIAGTDAFRFRRMPDE